MPLAEQKMMRLAKFFHFSTLDFQLFLLPLQP